MTHEQNLSSKDIKLYVKLYPQAWVDAVVALSFSFYLGFVEMSFHSYSPKSPSAQSQRESWAWNISIEHQMHDLISLDIF